MKTMSGSQTSGFLMFGVCFALLFSFGTAEAQQWKQRKQKDCDVHSTSQYRCLSNASMEVPAQKVIIKSKSTKLVTFSYDEWHSTCASAGGKVQSDGMAISANGEVGIHLLAPGEGISCRESYVHDCKEDGKAKNCKDVLSVILASYVGNQQS